MKADMENLYGELMRASSVLHWLGKYDVANAMILFARFLRASSICTLDEFENGPLAKAEEEYSKSHPED